MLAQSLMLEVEAAAGHRKRTSQALAERFRRSTGDPTAAILPSGVPSVVKP